LAIPFFKPDGSRLGYTRLKPDKPRITKKERETAKDKGREPKSTKYESPKGRGGHIYFPPGSASQLQDITINLVISEGEKKCLSGTQAGLLTLGLVGVWGWMKPRKKDEKSRPIGQRELHPELEAVAWQGRRVFVLFDSDAFRNIEVRKAAKALAEILEERGAKVRILFFESDAGSKVGLDDYLVKHSREELDELLKRAAVPHRKIKIPRKSCTQNTQNTQKIEGDYFVDGGRIFRRVWNRDGQGSYALCNFVARITEQVTLDDGSGQNETYLTVSGTLAGGRNLGDARVTSSEYLNLNWVIREWGAAAIVKAGQGAKDQLREAIQQLSKDFKRRHVFRHTGWRKIGEKWYYLHSAGAIGPDGLTTAVCVELDAKLRYYALPEVLTGEALKESVRASLELRKLAPARIMAPGQGAVYLAPLGQVIDASIFLYGPTGGGKSEVEAQLLQHYGPTMDRKNLPGSWTGTANALERLMFIVKDSLFVIDDFKPGGSRSENDSAHAKADRVFRGQGNHQSRDRCNADSTLKESYPSRCMLLASGEDRPRGESCAARRLDLAVRAHKGDQPGDVDFKELTASQDKAAKGIYAQAMAAYLCWLARTGLDRVQEAFKEQRQKLRSEILSTGHARTPGFLADLGTGWRFFLEFASGSGAITEAEREEYWQRAWKGILDAGVEQQIEIDGLNPVKRYFQLLSSGISSGEFHLENTSGGPPVVHPEGRGWRSETFMVGGYEREEWKPQGRCVGWIDGEHLYLDSGSAFAAAQKIGEQQGERIALGEKQLNKRLEEDGYLVTKSDKKQVVQRTVQGHRKWVLHLRVSHLETPTPGKWVKCMQCVQDEGPHWENGQNCCTQNGDCTQNMDASAPNPLDDCIQTEKTCADASDSQTTYCNGTASIAHISSISQGVGGPGSEKTAEPDFDAVDELANRATRAWKDRYDAERDLACGGGRRQLRQRP
jgi:hypothetical protein